VAVGLGVVVVTVPQKLQVAGQFCLMNRRQFSLDVHLFCS